MSLLLSLFVTFAFYLTKCYLTLFVVVNILYSEYILFTEQIVQVRWNSRSASARLARWRTCRWESFTWGARSTTRPPSSWCYNTISSASGWPSSANHSSPFPGPSNRASRRPASSSDLLVLPTKATRSCTIASHLRYKRQKEKLLFKLKILLLFMRRGLLQLSLG